MTGEANFVGSDFGVKSIFGKRKPWRSYGLQEDALRLGGGGFRPKGESAV
jgi:hypothetical protein